MQSMTHQKTIIRDTEELRLHCHLSHPRCPGPQSWRGRAAAAGGRPASASWRRMRWRWRPGSGPRARAGPTAWDGGLVNKVITAASTSSVCLLFVHKLTLSSVIRNLSISSANSDGSRGPREGWPVVCCLSGQSSSVHQLPSPYQDNNIIYCCPAKL